MPGTESVLVFDDTGPRGPAYRVLSSVGYRVFEASSVEEVAEVLEYSERPLRRDIIDVPRASFHSLALCEQLRSNHQSLRILLTTPGGIKVASERLTAMDVKLLTKPFTPDRLLQSVRDALDD
jgi:DNA-binding NtrC family response regulator